MKWTEEEARRHFSPNPQWGHHSAGWMAAQALIAALDTERERNAKLEGTLVWLQVNEGWQWSEATQEHVSAALETSHD